jgi:hypothetical protein
LGAGGKVWAILLIFRASAAEHSKPILKDLFKNSGNKSYKIFIAVTDSGWMTKTVWEDVMEKFVALIKPWESDHGAILLLDHLPSHESGTTIGLVSQNIIRVGFFPPDTSSFMQPADSYAFARLEQEIHRRVYELLQSFLISSKPDVHFSRSYTRCITISVDEGVHHGIVPRHAKIFGFFFEAAKTC